MYSQIYNAVHCDFETILWVKLHVIQSVCVFLLINTPLTLNDSIEQICLDPKGKKALQHRCQRPKMLLNINKLDIPGKTSLVVYSRECVHVHVSTTSFPRDPSETKEAQKHRCVFGVIELHANDYKEFMRVCVREKTPDSEKTETEGRQIYCSHLSSHL